MKLIDSFQISKVKCRHTGRNIFEILNSKIDSKHVCYLYHLRCRKCNRTWKYYVPLDSPLEATRVMVAL